LTHQETYVAQHGRFSFLFLSTDLNIQILLYIIPKKNPKPDNLSHQHLGFFFKRIGHFRDEFGHQHAAAFLDVVLVEGIVYLLAFLAAFHHVSDFQYVQVVGDGRR
jgi:hypothetical protein